MIGLILLLLAQPAPAPTAIRWTTDGGSIAATWLPAGTVLASGISGGSNTGDQTKTCSANQWLSTLAAGTSSVCTQPAFSSLSGAATLAQNGTAAGAPAADDQALVSDSTSAATWRTIPECDGATKALNYRQATNSFACNTFTTGSGYSTIQEEGSSLTQRDTLNFVGAITCVDDTTRTTCTVSGGSGTSPLTLAFGAF